MSFVLRAMLAGGLVLIGGNLLANAPDPGPREEPAPAPLTVRRAEPKPMNSVTVPVTVKNDLAPAGGVKAKIVISQKLLAELTAKKGAEAPPAAERQSSLSNPRTMIAGLAMSLAAVSLVFVTRGKRTVGKVTLVVMACVFLLGGVGLLYADIAVPGQPFRPRGPVRPPADQVLIEVVEDAPGVTLVLPPK